MTYPEDDNEALLREGECPAPNCIEVAGHKGLHSGEETYEGWDGDLVARERDKVQQQEEVGHLRELYYSSEGYPPEEEP